MPRTRRSALVAVLALAGGLALTGCGRAQPGTAAYVGETRYTERQIDTIVDEIRSSASGNQLPNPRATVVGWLVMADLGRRAAEERSITIPASDYDLLAEQTGLPSDSATVRAVADWAAVYNAIARRVTTDQQAGPVTPSDEDLREIYEVLHADPRLEDLTFEEVAAQLRQIPEVAISVAVRNALREAAAKHRLVVNPRYRPLVANLPLAGELNNLPLVLAVGSDLVAERSQG
jgi:hypothetical protein